MTKVLVTESSLNDIAEAIRGKNGSGNTYTPGQMAAAITAIPTGITPTGTIPISANGTVDVTQYASASVNVPNSYAAGDEGKVVSNGALVAQSSGSTTQNGTVDTTLINSLTVNVSGGGGGGILTGTTPPSASVGSNGDFYMQTAADGTLASDGACYINTNITQNARYKVEIEAAITELTTNYDTLFGCRNGSNARFTARFANSTNGNLAIHKSTQPGASYSNAPTSVAKNTMLNTYKKITVKDFVAIDDFVIMGMSTSNTSDFPYPIFVFANNDAGTPGDYAYCAVKTFKMWDEDGKLVMYLNPATQNGVACMYDLVTGNYFSNDGAGTFTHTNAGTTRDALLWKKISGTWQIVGVVG